MSENQQVKITTFDFEKNSRPIGESNSSTAELMYPERTRFNSPPEDYPAGEIEEIATEQATASLCLPTTEVSVTYGKIAGTGGMGPAKDLEADQDAVFETVKGLLPTPAIISGGGMNTPMGSGLKYCCVESVDEADGPDTIGVTGTSLYSRRAKAREEDSKYVLGRYTFWIPVTQEDYIQSVNALDAWSLGKTDYFVAKKRQVAEKADRLLGDFNLLSPADRVDVPAYESTLTVISEPWETHAVIQNGTLGKKTKSVTAVTVDNPNGGYYQLGVSEDTGGRYSDEYPTCYLSSSYQSPPTPNTYFRREHQFSTTDIHIRPIEHPPDPTCIGPDEDVLQSPLPETILRTDITDIDGVGEKTHKKLFKVTNSGTSAESIATTLYGQDGPHSDVREEIEDILSNLPQSETVFNRLKEYNYKQ